MPEPNQKWTLPVPEESLITLPDLPVWAVLSLILLVATAESLAFIGLVLPGVALLFALAFAAGSTGMDLGTCLAMALTGALLGDGISFWLGKHSTERIRKLGLVKRHPAWLEQGERFFARWGGLSILLGRFIGPLRPVIPFVAGSCRMPTPRFMLYNLLSALGWAPAYLLPGYFTGRGLQSMPPALEPLLWLVAGLVFVLLFWQQLHHRLHPDSVLSQRLGQLLPGPWPPSPMVMLISTAGLLLLSTALTLSPSGNSLNQSLLPTLSALGALLPKTVLSVTLLGDLELALIVALATSLFGALWLRQTQAWGVILGTLTVIALNVLLKHLFAIDRPEQAALTTFSFPSGHASAAAAWIGLTCTWWAHNRPHSQRHNSYLVAAPLILLIGLSRCLLGVHWPLDVVAGIAEGLAVAAVYRIWLYRYPAKTLAPPGWLGALLILALGYVAWQLGPAALAYRIG